MMHIMATGLDSLKSQKQLGSGPLVPNFREGKSKYMATEELFDKNQIALHFLIKLFNFYIYFFTVVEAECI